MPRKPKTFVAPEGYFPVRPGYWATKLDCVLKDATGVEVTVPAGTVLTIRGWSEGFPNWDATKGVYDFRATLSGHPVELVGQVSAVRPSRNQPYDAPHVSTEMLRPMAFPEDRPAHVQLPPTWLAGTPDETDLGREASGSRVDTFYEGRRHLPGVDVEHTDDYDVWVVLDVPGKLGRKYSDRRADIETVLAATEEAWVTVTPIAEAGYPRPGGDQRKVALRDLPEAWMAAIRFADLCVRDESVRAAEYRARQDRAHASACEAFGATTLLEAMPVLEAGGMIQKVMIEKHSHGGVWADIHVVTSDRKSIGGRVNPDRRDPFDEWAPDVSKIVGVLSVEEAGRLVREASDHFMGFVEHSTIRRRWPNRHGQWVLPTDPEARAGPRLTARSLIRWGDLSCDGFCRVTGTTPTGAVWEIQVVERNGDTRADLFRNMWCGDLSEEREDTHHETLVVFGKAGEMAQTFLRAVDLAYGTEALLYLTSSNLTIGRLPVSDFSPEILASVVRTDMRRLRLERDEWSRQRIERRLAAVRWELAERIGEEAWTMGMEEVASEPAADTGDDPFGGSDIEDFELA